MNADAKKPKLRDGVPSKIEIFLGIGVALAIYGGLGLWAITRPKDRHVLPGGVTVLQENQVFLAVAMLLCIVLTVFGIAVLWRKPWRRLGLAGSLCLGVGLLFGALPVSFMAQSDVMTFTPAGVTMSAPWWLGAAPRTKLIYSDIEWLGTRERIHWEKDEKPSRYLSQWLIGGTPGWRRVEIVEHLIKVRGRDQATVTFDWRAWREITGAARAAGVMVKPVDRIEQPRPTT